MSLEELDKKNGIKEDTDSSNTTTQQQNDTATPEENKWKNLLLLYKRDMQNLTDLRDRAALLFIMGEIYEFQMQNQIKALKYYQQSYQTDPTYIPPIKAATRIFSKIGNYPMVLKLLKNLEESAQSTDEKIGGMIERAKVLIFHMNEPEQAEAILKEALEMDPSNEVVQKLLEQVYLKQNDREKLLAFYERMAKEGTGGVRLDALLHLGSVKKRDAEQVEQAIAQLEEVLKEEPQNAVALAALSMLYTRFGMWEDLVRILEQQLAQAPSEEIPSLCYRLGRLWRDELKNPNLATNYFRQGLEREPENLTLLYELSATLEQEKNWQELHDVYMKLLNVIHSEEQRLDILLKLAALCEDRLDRPDEALDHYQAIIDLKPDYVPVVTRIAKLYARQGEWERLITLTLRESERLPDPKLKASRYFRIAEIYEENLNQPDRAIEYYRKVLEVLPGYIPAIKALAGIFNRLERWEELIDINQQEIDITQNKDHLVYLYHLNAQIWQNRLGKPEQAIECYKKALKANPDHMPTIQALGKLYARLGMWNELIEINSLEAELVTDQKRMIALLYKNGEIAEKELQDNDRALKFYQQVLSIQPDHLPALRAVGNLYLRDGRWEELIRMYRQELRISREPAQKTQLLYRIGAVFEEELGELEAAEEYYEQILEIDPGSLMALHALERVHRRSGNQEKLIEVYSRIAEHAQDTETKLYYLFKVAEIYEELSIAPMAERTYKRMLSIDPTHIPASRALRRLLVMDDRFEEILPLLKAELDLAKSDAERTELLAELAEIYQSIPEHESETLEVYERILEIDPDNMLALRELERLYEKNGQFEQLAAIYERRIELAPDKETKIAYRWLLADLHQQLNPDHDPVEDYEAILAENPADTRAVDRLVAIYISQERWEDVLRVYANAAENARTDEDKVFFLMLHGQVLEMQLEDYEGAVATYSKVLEMKPKHLPAISGLKRCYARTENWQEMQRILERELETVTNESKRVATYYQLAFLHETKLDNPELAIQFYKNAIEIQRSHAESFARLEALLRRQENWNELMALYAKRLPTITDDEQAAKIQFEIGTILEDKLNEPTKAVTHYQAAIDKNPNFKDALWRLVEIYLMSEKWSEADLILEKLSALVEDRDEMVALAKAQALLYTDKLSNVPKAIAALEELVSLGEDVEENRRRLAELYAAEGRKEDAIAILRTLIKNSNDKQRLVEYNLTTAKLYESLNQPDKAIRYMEAALGLDPANEYTLKALAEMFGRRGEWGKLVELYRHQIDAIPEEDKQARAAVLASLAGVYKELNDLNAAEEMLREALVADPTNIDVRKRLAEILKKQPHKQDSALEVLREIVSLDPYDPYPYHEMFDIFDSNKKRDESFCTAAVTFYLKEATEAERELYERLSSAVVGEAMLIKQEHLVRHLIHPSEKGLISEIVRLIAPALYKLLPPDLSKYKLSSAQKLNAAHPLSMLSESIGFHLGVERLDIYVSKDNPYLFAVEPTKPPTLIMGSALAFAHEKLKRFFLGVAIARILRGHTLHIESSAEEIKKIVDAVCHQYIPSAIPMDSYDFAEIEELGRGIIKNLSRTQKRQIEPLAKQYAEEMDSIDINKWIFGLFGTEYRMGMLVAGDITAVPRGWHILNNLEYHEPANSQEAKAMFGSITQLKELFAFAVSEEFFQLRKETKTAL